MKTKKAVGYAKIESEALQRLLRYPLFAIAVHWTFQSLFYMDPTERRFKLGLDIGLTIAGSAFLCIWWPWQTALPLSFLTAHTVNFLFNGQLWGVLKHYGLINQSYEAFNAYVRDLGKRVNREPSIHRTTICGSLSRHQWSPSSDIDLRIIRYPGFKNGLRACWFLLRERSRALVFKFPLDAYIVESQETLQKLTAGDPPLTLATWHTLLEAQDISRRKSAE